MFDLDNSRVGLYGDVEYAPIPYTILDYLVLGVSSILAVVLAYVICHICRERNREAQNEERKRLHEQREINRLFEYKELPDREMRRHERLKSSSSGGSYK